MAPQWSKEAIEALIRTSREEQCPYVIKSANYYNKHLRAETLERIASAVCHDQPYTTSKECYSKIHNLRTQFKVEYARVKSSKSSGAGMNDTCSLSSSQSVDMEPSPHQYMEECYSLDVDVLNDVCIVEQCAEVPPQTTVRTAAPPQPPIHASQSRDGRRKRPGDGYMSAVEVIADKICATRRPPTTLGRVNYGQLHGIHC
ncbi:uncharacterized protein LOC126458617 [Schistocerca serialis cubense]|uniref:uncharacterized protein LOC126458617 n=1 Tax=Schistocerca serialis cubense TaxID=2023355 RepID=UPI00214E578A|nr:uncharacterized protein LOC126458617 [Schistocerca serialis cubense]